MVDSPKIQKKGLTMHYELHPDDHLEIQSEVFQKLNPYATNFTPSDEFEVMISGILIKFTKASLAK